MVPGKRVLGLSVDKQELFGVDQGPQEILIAFFGTWAVLQEFSAEGDFFRAGTTNQGCQEELVHDVVMSRFIGE